MPFEPRSTDAIVQALAARIVARSKLSDIAESAVLLALIETVAEELAGVEQAISTQRDSFNFLDPDISEADYDARVAELPTTTAQRRPSTSAAGSVVTVSRAAGDTADELILAAGTVFRRSDDPTKLYRTTQAYTLGIGVASVSGVYVVCLVPGSGGNCAAGTVNTLVSGSSRIVAVTNTSPITSGVDAETVAQAQARSAGYFASLSRTTPPAQEYLALAFEGSAGQRVRFAKVWRDWTRPGYAELVVDDGTGLGGLTRSGATTSGVVPVGGQIYLWHEKPATAPIERIDVTLAGGAGNAVLYAENGDFVSLPEMGLLVVRDGELAAGDAWQVSNYTVYTGILAELQAEAQGDPNAPATTPGWIADGCRLAVRPPVVVPVYLDLHVVPQNFVELAVLQLQAVNDAVSYIASLAPGEPLYIAKLIDALLDNNDVLNVHVYQQGTSTAATDVYCKPYEALRTDSSKIGIVSTLAGS